MNIGDVNGNYWVYESEGRSDGSGGEGFVIFIKDGEICEESTGGTSDGCNGYGGNDIGPYNFRLCFKLKDDLSIASGNGKEKNPYQLVEAE